MVFHYRQRKLRDGDILKLKINESEIERVQEFNFLGLTIDEHMTWCSHIRKISNKISRVVGIMNRLKHFLPHSALKLMYNSLINRNFQFCTTAWGYQLNRLSKLQKRAIRIMCNAKYKAHTEPLFKENKLFTIEDIFKLNCLKFYHKFINKKVPKFFKDIFTRNSDVHSYETRNRDRPHYFPYNREGSSKRIRHSIPNLIQSLSMEIRGKL